MTTYIQWLVKFLGTNSQTHGHSITFIYYFLGYENGGYGFDPGCSTSKYSRIESSRLDTSRLSRMETSRLDTSRLSRMETCRASLDEFIPKPEEENEDDYLAIILIDSLLNKDVKIHK